MVNPSSNEILVSTIGPNYKLVQNGQRERKYVIPRTSFKSYRLMATFHLENDRLFIIPKGTDSPFNVKNQYGYNLSDELGSITMINGIPTSNKIILVSQIQKSIKNKDDITIIYKGDELIHPIFPEKEIADFAKTKLERICFPIPLLQTDLIIPEEDLGYDICDVNTDDDFLLAMAAFTKEFRIRISSILVNCRFCDETDSHCVSNELRETILRNLTIDKVIFPIDNEQIPNSSIKIYKNALDNLDLFYSNLSKLKGREIYIMYKLPEQYCKLLFNKGEHVEINNSKGKVRLLKSKYDDDDSEPEIKTITIKNNSTKTPRFNIADYLSSSSSDSDYE